MKHSDTYLREKLAQKLTNYETPVPEALWAPVAKQMGTPVAGGRHWGWSKIIGAAFVITAILGVAVFATINVTIPKSNTEQNNSADSTSQVESQAVPVHKATEEQKTQSEAPFNPASKEEAEVSLPQEPFQFGPGVTHAEAKNEVMEFPYKNAEVQPEEVKTSMLKAVANQINFSVISSEKNEMFFFFIPEITTATSYSWNFGDGETSAEMSPSHEYVEARDFEVKLSIEDASGVKQIAKQISAWPKAVLEAMSIFTPNNDGKNDIFDVTSLSRNVYIHKILVYNQDGSRVFEGDGERQWDGTDILGNALPTGNYIYDIHASDLRQQPVEKRGLVYLRR